MQAGQVRQNSPGWDFRPEGDTLLASYKTGASEHFALETALTLGLADHIFRLAEELALSILARLSGPLGGRHRSLTRYRPI